MVSGDAILAGSITVGGAVLAGAWRLSAMLTRLHAVQDEQSKKVDEINTVVSSAALLNGKGDSLVRDVAVIRSDLRTHIANSDITHAALWSALTEPQEH